MAENSKDHRPHFVFHHNGQTEPFSRPKQKIDEKGIPPRNRQAHGTALKSQIEKLVPTLADAVGQQRQAGMDEGFGLQIEFESFPDIELAFQSLESQRSGIELRNVRYDDHKTYATVFVPDGKLKFFENKIAAYLDETKDKKSGPAHSKLLNAIAEIRAATLKALWTDTPDSMPTDDDESLWWEVWLPKRKDRQGVLNQFREMATGLGFRLAPGELHFPERSVLLVYGSVGQMKRSMLILNSIAELRRAKETAEFFDSLVPQEQHEWVDELNTRLTIPEETADVPHVCLLDTGVNNGHPLLKRALDTADLHSVEPGWGVNDSEGHGTEMAGLALLGNLTEVLSTQYPVSVPHRLESVKLIPHDGANGQDARHHGYLTAEAVDRPSVTAPDRKRVYSMAVTARDNRDRGRPSAWSATLDRLACDADAQGETPRLYWPLKPDVVFEGGNAARDGLGGAWTSSLSLLTTCAHTNERLFTITNATSAASALCARMAAQLMAQYPDLWPETIRGLIVHSAEWTEAMKRMFLPTGGAPKKRDVVRLVRHCGFGEPNLDRALWSAGNSLTMICEESLHPFRGGKGREPTYRDMNLHSLPWPKSELEALGETEVEMRVTLSYFIEPNPSARGVTSRYRYESHGLRFDVKRPSESDPEFRARINAAARDDEEGLSKTGSDSDPFWLLGKNNRHRGSLHSDIWKGTAADLASRGMIAVYPSLGWWKTRPALERYNQSVRYSLIVSIRAPEVEVDLYTPIANQVGLPVEV